MFCSQAQALAFLILSELSGTFLISRAAISEYPDILGILRIKGFRNRMSIACEIIFF